jgi:hypothetical protein
MSFVQALANYEEPPESSVTEDDRQFLQAWAADIRAEETWQSFHAACPRTSEAMFIQLVLAARTVAKSADSVPPIVASFLALERKNLRILVKDALAAPSDSIRADILGEAAVRARRIADWADSFDEKNNFIVRLNNLSRQGKGDTRPRKIFMNFASDHLHMLCGHRLNGVVATLTEIVFPGPEIDPDHVRTARRPTTRKARYRKRNTEFPATAGK